MWISYFNWFLAIFSIVIWVGTYFLYERDRVKDWFDNKFGKDDPMPPTPDKHEHPSGGKTLGTINYHETDSPPEA